MNIVYGVSGEGLGHVFEAIEVIKRLRREGHAVKVLTYGDRAYKSLEAFGPTRIEGVALYFNSGGMSLWETARRNWRIIPFYIRHWRRLRRELVAFCPDVFVTAYEPFTTVASHVLRKPLISMDNQNELLHMEPPEGTDMFAFRLARLATRACTYGASVFIVKTLDKPSSRSDRIRYVSPIIQDEIRRLTPTIGKHVLVYLTKPNPRLLEILKSMDETFFVYCNNKLGTDGNISYRAQGTTYVEDLGSCKAIIATTGFSLIADSIYLKKPFFGAPLLKQFEQTHNAHFLAQSGLGEYSESTTKEQLEEFLSNLPRYRRRLSLVDLDPAEQEETLLSVLGETVAGSARRHGGSRAFSADSRKGLSGSRSRE